MYCNINAARGRAENKINDKFFSNWRKMKRKGEGDSWKLGEGWRKIFIKSKT